MITNTNLKEIAEILEKADSVLLFPHENADCDGIGSCTALCLALRSKGKNAWTLVGEELSNYTGFLDMGCCTTDEDIIEEPDVCVVLDCSEDSRLSWRVEKFNSAETRVCIDHHQAFSGYGDFYYIDPEESSASQMVFMLLKEMDGVKITSDIATAAFAGISADTGNFRYESTNPQTHRIAAELLEVGIPHNDIVVHLYQNKDIREVKMKAKALEVMEPVAGGKGVISYISREMRAECNAEYEHTESVIDDLRDIEGVEIAVLIKEKDPGVFKVSARAKSTGNVEQIVSAFGGGGHIKAAGCTINGMTMEEAKSALIKEIERAFS